MGTEQRLIISQVVALCSQ